MHVMQRHVYRGMMICTGTIQVLSLKHFNFTFCHYLDLAKLYQYRATQETEILELQ